jgi:hypothetical protein
MNKDSENPKEAGRSIPGVRLVVLLWVCLCLSACGGGGGGSGGDRLGIAPSKLFVADSGTDVIGSVANPNPAPGTIQVDRIISSNQLSGNLPALFLDASQDELYVSTEISLVVFNRASVTNGLTDISRRVATVSPLGGGNFNSLYLDSTRDMLYVGDQPNGVRVYHNARTANELGAPDNLPNRTLSGNFGANFAIRDVAVDTIKDILYVAVVNTLPSMSVMAFHNASSVDGSVTPTRTITIPASVYGTMGLFIDPGRDRLYVADSASNVLVFETASIKTDPVAPDRSVILPSPPVTRLTVDTTNDRLYAAGGSAVYIVPGISTATGTVSATAALAGPGSNFTAVAVTP